MYYLTCIGPAEPFGLQVKERSLFCNLQKEGDDTGTWHRIQYRKSDHWKNMIFSQKIKINLVDNLDKVIKLLLDILIFDLPLSMFGLLWPFWTEKRRRKNTTCLYLGCQFCRSPLRLTTRSCKFTSGSLPPIFRFLTIAISPPRNAACSSSLGKTLLHLPPHVKRSGGSARLSAAACCRIGPYGDVCTSWCLSLILF